MTVEEALRAAPIDPREARLLLAAAAELSEAGVIGFPERVLRPEAESRFRAYVERRAQGEPVAYILGKKEFYGLELAVTPAVLIPRPETELLVDLALECGFSSALDLGTGSGAIALALKRHRPQARVVAVDASADALAVAGRNAARHGCVIDLRHGRWLEPVAGERFDLIVANPPYVAEGDTHLAQLAFEPRDALVSGPDGLEAIRQILRAAPRHLLSGGRLLLEHGAGQDALVAEALRAAGLEDVRTWPDLAGIPRVTGGRVKEG